MLSSQHKHIMYENTISGGTAIEDSGQFDQAPRTHSRLVFSSFDSTNRVLHPVDPYAYTCFSLHHVASCHFTWRPLTSFTLIVCSEAPGAKGNRAPPALSIVDSFFPLLWQGYAVGSIVPSACHLVLAVSRAPLVAMHGDAQSDSRRPPLQVD
jgi:hypothetical protein